MKKFCAFVFSVLVSFSAVNAQTQAPLLSKITFDGLKRTHESFLQDEFAPYINCPLTPKALNDIESDLQALNLFSSIEFTMKPAAESSDEQDDSLELLVTVKEKISFIPLPFVMYSSGSGFMGGGFIMDMNAGGKKDMFVTGLIWSLDRTLVMGTYTQSPKIGKPGFNVFGSVSRQTTKMRNTDGDLLLEFDNVSANARANLLLKLNRYNTVNTGIGYSGFFPIDSDVHPDLYLRNCGTATAGWNISDNDWNGVFLSETSFGLDVDFSIDNKAQAVTELASMLKVQQPLMKKLRMNIDAGGGIVLNGLITDGRSKATGRVTILDDKFSTDRIAGASSGLEFAFLQPVKIGTFSVYGNYEVVFAREFDDSLLFCQGFNTGMKVYMSGLAFPAVSIGLAYNATKNIFYFSGSFGVSF